MHGGQVFKSKITKHFFTLLEVLLSFDVSSLPLQNQMTLVNKAKHLLQMQIPVKKAELTCFYISLRKVVRIDLSKLILKPNLLVPNHQWMNAKILMDDLGITEKGLSPLG